MEKYKNIINLPHPTSSKHPRMAMIDRAAQFSPFAALTGYDAAIEEAARYVGGRVELDEGMRVAIDRKLQYLSSIINEHPAVTVTCFQPDEHKEGGEYILITGDLKRIDDCDGKLILVDGRSISITDVLSVESERLWSGL